MERKRKVEEEQEEKSLDEKVVEEVVEEEQEEVVEEEQEEVVEDVKPKETTKATSKIVVPDPVQEDPRIWYRKVGGGSLRFGNRIVKPGEKIQLDPSEVKPAWKDLLIPLSEVPVKKEAPIKLDITKSAYSLKQRGEGGLWWDVVDSQGKVVNDKALRKEKAEEYIKDMMR